MLHKTLRDKLKGDILLTGGEGPEAAAINRLLAPALKDGSLKKLCPTVYTTSKARPEEVLLQNLYRILGHLYPGAVISHRSAIETGPREGHIVLSYSYTKKVRLPGLIVHLVEAPEGQLHGDMPIGQGLFIASPERAWLENLRPTKAHGFSRILPQETLEEEIDARIRRSGIEALKERLPIMEQIADKLGLENSLQRFIAIVEALSGESPAKGVLKSDLAKKRAEGHPYDPGRLKLFETLFSSLRVNAGGIQRHELPKEITSEGVTNLCFFDAYFSNYIEGTKFEISEALEIVRYGKIPPHRPDGHDVKATFELLRTNVEQKPAAFDRYDDFQKELKSTHKHLMASHSGLYPGEFKQKLNFAGSTAFVEPGLVQGTLRVAFDLYRALPEGFSRAAFLKFLIAEVHPFTDGNGRLSRIFMNRELLAVGELPIIITTVYRGNYLDAMRKLTRAGEPAAYIKMLARAQNLTAALDFGDYNSLLSHLRAIHAFSEDTADPGAIFAGIIERSV
ncbi:MAG TPA: Fic family protein [Oligoflexus sp.]|uniref:Fic family protein n=1 Tax=Oligoflexus sp. TaxID=1971216 RepID=UPI002D80119A|nr:Fic family protein [Oligoflexus sp.]HET9237826.1 Fic family protein [Oligoflexus sp.]